MHIMPILSTLRRHRTAAILIVLEISLTCAIVCNALFIIGERMARMEVVSGVVEDELIRIQLTGIGQDDKAGDLTRRDIEALRALPGVKAVTTTNQLPFGNSSWNSDMDLEKDQIHSTLSASTYFGTDDQLETFGVRLLAGRDFNPDEYVEFDDKEAKTKVIIVTREVAEKSFPGQNALGKTVYMGKDPLVIVGIVERLIRPNDFRGPTGQGYSVFLPVRMSYAVGGNYLIRVDPARKAETLKAGVAALTRNSPNRIILEQKLYSEIRDEYFRGDRSMAWLLVAVCIALLVITALGIVGLASFWVQQRTRQIGIRRALGATRRQILRYFQTENFLLATVGIVLGMAFAYGINMWLMERYELPRLPFMFLPVGAITLWGLGQLAVLGPAMRAAAVPPAVATRTV